MNRGSPRNCERSCDRMRRFNEAPIHESGKSQTRLVSMMAAAIASMRPRFMNRGSQLLPQLADRVRDASMRPRFMNRGSEQGNDALLPDGKLLQ